MSTLHIEDAPSHSGTNICINLCLCRCCCQDRGAYDCCDMTHKVIIKEQPLDRQCLQYTLCDDESSSCCRACYITALICCNPYGCLNSCLPKCSICHKVEHLERGVCDACWDDLIDRMQSLVDHFGTWERTRTGPSPDPLVPPAPAQDTLTRLKITDRASARAWLIKNHPDRGVTKDYNVEDFQSVLAYYKNTS